MKKLACIALLCAFLSPSWAIEVTLDLQVRNDTSRPVVSIKTNLPPKTQFMAMMINPINQGGDGLIRESQAEVQSDQTVQFLELSKNGKPFPNGHYILHISASPHVQSTEVKRILGLKGERLTSPNVRHETVGSMVYRQYRFNLNPDGSLTHVSAQQTKQKPPMNRVYQGNISLPDFKGRDSKFSTYRTRITDEMKTGPNFAGHYAIIVIGCGTSCRFAFLGDVASGQMHQFPYGGEENYDMDLRFDVKSNEVAVRWISGDNCLKDDLTWDGYQFTSRGVRRLGSREFCEAG